MDGDKVSSPAPTTNTDSSSSEGDGNGENAQCNSYNFVSNNLGDPGDKCSSKKDCISGLDCQDRRCRGMPAFANISITN